MPFELKLTLFEKLKIKVLLFIYSIFKKEKDFDFQNFNSWANRLGIILPLAFQAKSARIDVVNAKWMVKNNEDRIAKVERTHKDKYKIDRHTKSFKVDTSTLKAHIEFLKTNYTHLYIKYTVGEKETSDSFKQENFTLHFGGISQKNGYFLNSNTGDFKTLDRNGILSDSNPKNDTSFKVKNENLKTPFPEFDECEMSGLIHFLESSGQNLGVLNWITQYLEPRGETHFYIKMGCSQKDNNSQTPEPTKVPVQSGSCDIKFLTSPIFTTEPNLTSSSFKLPPPPKDEYYDAGTGCCP